MTIDEKYYLNQLYEQLSLLLLNTSSAIDVKWLSFDQWWNSQVIVSDIEALSRNFTRGDFVLIMAENDGGVHIDKVSSIDEIYLSLSNASKSYIYHTEPSGVEVPAKYIHYAIVRQIAHELIISLISHFKISISYNPTNKYNLRGIPSNKIVQPSFIVEGKSIESERTNHPLKLYQGETFTTPQNAKYMRIFY